MKFPFKIKMITLGIAAGLALTAGVDAWADKASPAENSALPLQEIRQFTDIFGAIKSYYVDPVGDKKLLEQAVTGMVAGLDPHSAYLDPESFKDLQEGTEGEFGGLGIEVTKDGRNGVQVVSPIDDTPAAKAGIRAGDLIVKLDGQFTYDLPLSKCVKLMRGEPKTPITLQIVRKGEKKPLTIKLVRDIIKVQSVKSKELPDGLGYIRITQFQERTVADLVKALQSLSKSGHLKGLVLDLRNNPGGLLDAAVGVCSQFLPQGSLVVSTKGRTPDSNKEFLTGQQLHFNAPAGASPEEAKTVPMVVLINPASASASEIVSGALQDHKRATLMGQRSFGKGSVQTIFPLAGSTKDSPTGIKLTTARYFTPSGRTIQATGIVPDIAVDDTPEGNYPSFNIREADLENHLTVDGAPAEKKNGDDDATPEDDFDRPAPKLTYHFGDDSDFPLQQAVHFLKGEPVARSKPVSGRKAAKQAEVSPGKAGDAAP
ncbi:MAG: S41 family peptidase [Mesosutterella sp.]|nr:S41 family peptidase [Mesosutterella sp.]